VSELRDSFARKGGKALPLSGTFSDIGAAESIVAQSWIDRAIGQSVASQRSSGMQLRYWSTRGPEYISEAA